MGVRPHYGSERLKVLAIGAELIKAFQIMIPCHTQVRHSKTV
jgi:hypothetical protein